MRDMLERKSRHGGVLCLAASVLDAFFSFVRREFYLQAFFFYFLIFLSCTLHSFLASARQFQSFFAFHSHLSARNAVCASR